MLTLCQSRRNLTLDYHNTPVGLKTKLPMTDGGPTGRTDRSHHMSTVDSLFRPHSFQKLMQYIYLLCIEKYFGPLLVATAAKSTECIYKYIYPFFWKIIYIIKMANC